MVQPSLTPAGDRALLVDFGAIAAGELHARAAVVRRTPGVIACIVGAQSLYVVFEGEPQTELRFDAAAAEAAPRRHAIEVNFDGEDAAEFFARVVPREEFLSRIGGLTLTARYLGFRAGFAYLDGWPAEWAMARRPTSRLRVPRGSFGIAAATAGFYPIESPGGWNLLGRTDAPLWDARREPPNLIAAGDEIAIVPVSREIVLPDIAAEPPSPNLGVPLAGRFSTIVTAADWSRIDAGISPGGPFDPDAAELANSLVGNAPGAPVVESAMLGPEIYFPEPRRVAWVGAPCDLTPRRAFEVSGQLRGGRIRDGLRGWLAIGGAHSTAAKSAPIPSGLRTERHVIRCGAGPHVTLLREIRCEVTPQLNRIGIRLRPLAPLPITAPADLPSCGMHFGTIQLHPDDSLVAMGPDHPITGGYLQPMTVLWEERWKLAQLAPGERVTLVTS